MIAKVFTATVIGLDAHLVEVEADVSNGLPATVIVGLPDAAVQESKERVKSAIKQSGFNYPATRVSVNLAPADVPKIGTQFDLPIALAILMAGREVELETENALFIGELSLDGSLRSVPGVLAMALLAQSAGIKNLFVPKDVVAEACLVEGVGVYGVESLSELTLFLQGLSPQTKPAKSRKTEFEQPAFALDMKDVAGQEMAKRALEIAASGGHNVLMSGPPGSGKTLLARALAGILPDLTRDEALELTKIYSVSGKLPRGGIILQRPVRNPHHTTSGVALVGGGTNPKPGEVTLSHRGILFLDELPEFQRGVLEALRQPLEDGVVTVSRAKSTFTFPAKFVLVAACNPCPCGFYGDPNKHCVCTPHLITKYKNKLSGPLLDRIDLHITVPRLSYDKLQNLSGGESSLSIKNRVEQARKIQLKRFGDSRTNSEMSVVEVRKYCVLDHAGNDLLKNASDKYNLSARSIHRLLKLSRTIADLVGSQDITKDHMAEALQYRPSDK